MSEEIDSKSPVRDVLELITSSIMVEDPDTVGNSKKSKCKSTSKDEENIDGSSVKISCHQDNKCNK